MEDRRKLLSYLPDLRGRKVLVIGDIFLDEYIFGKATRLSREAPIPVLEFEGRRFIPGGAANPAANVVALEGYAYQVGVVGEDEEGAILLKELEKAGINTSGVVTDPSRPTTVKTRIVARGSLRFPQQIARIDRLNRRPVNGEVEDSLITRIEEIIPQVEAVLISDYRTGVVTERVVDAARKSARKYGKLLTVDSQGNLEPYVGFDLVKCNRAEAESALHCSLESEGDFEEGMKRILRRLNLGAFLITRGPEGMSLLGKGEPYSHIPAANVTEVFDVTGAGDTVIAVVTVALTAGIRLLDAARLANYAAGLVVRKLGNATPSIRELAWAIEQWGQ
ncbi:MAG: ribokinase [Chloroflexi bacterium]|nr:MAG: ribokinase [Chloroflexota bacterium]